MSRMPRFQRKDLPPPAQPKVREPIFWKTVSLAAREYAYRDLLIRANEEMYRSAFMPLLPGQYGPVNSMQIFESPTDLIKFYSATMAPVKIDKQYIIAGIDFAKDEEK